MEVALNPNERTRASYVMEDFLPIGDSKYLCLVDDEVIEVDKGFFLVKIGGHTCTIINV